MKIYAVQQCWPYDSQEQTLCYCLTKQIASREKRKVLSVQPRYKNGKRKHTWPRYYIETIEIMES